MQGLIQDFKIENLTDCPRDISEAMDNIKIANPWLLWHNVDVLVSKMVVGTRESAASRWYVTPVAYGVDNSKN